MDRWLFICLVCFAWPAQAQNLPAASDGRHVWAVHAQSDAAGLVLWHHAPGDPSGTMRRVEALRGRLIGGAELAAADGVLWLVYSDRSLQRVRVEPGELEGQWRYQEVRQRRLPLGTRLRSLAANGDDVWALLTVESPETLAELDAPRPARSAEDKAIERSILLKLPPEQVQTPSPDEAQEPEPQPEGEPAPGAAPAMPVDRLLRLVGGRWQMVALPEDWPHNTRSALVGGAGPNERPLLLAQTRQNQARRTTLSVYEPRDETAWHRVDYELETVAPWAAVKVDGQLVLAQRGGGLRVSLAVLRQGRTFELGNVELPDPRTDWQLLPAGNAAAVMYAVGDTPDDHPGVGWVRLDLTGRMLGGPAVMKPDPRPARAQRMQWVMFVGVIVLSMLMLFVFWQRDPRQNRPNLDERTRVGRLSKRLTAALLDLAPATAAAMVYYGQSAPQLYTHWRRLQIDPVASEPAVAVIVFFVAYVLLSELVSATTPGKRIVGLRVSDLNGARPRPWQVIVRNGLKLFDLVAWPLLVLPLLSPFRQRLGDLVAATLVVETKPQENEQATKE